LIAHAINFQSKDLRLLSSAESPLALLLGWSAAYSPARDIRKVNRRRSMEIRTIGIDLGKTVFHLVGINPVGKVVVRKKCSRKMPQRQRY
jgi:hypothetical protein